MVIVQGTETGSLKMTIRKKVAETAGIKPGDNVEFSVIDGDRIRAKPGDLVLRMI